MNRPLLVLLGAVAAAAVGIVVIPAPKPSPNFSRAGAANMGQGPAGAAGRASAAPPLRDTEWSELMPKDWDPYEQIRQLQQGVHIASDGDPRAAEVLRQMRELWNNAPINPAVGGAAVRIAGYVVPLDMGTQGLKEFLLVPYFGACIHSPPPPSNQIIHVTLREAARGVRSMDAVWIGGTLQIVRSASAMGVGSYGMEATSVEPYAVAEQD